MSSLSPAVEADARWHAALSRRVALAFLCRTVRCPFLLMLFRHRPYHPVVHHHRT